MGRIASRQCSNDTVEKNMLKDAGAKANIHAKRDVLAHRVRRGINPLPNTPPPSFSLSPL